MAKQSTITFRTLGVNGAAQALHLLKQQGFVEVGSIQVGEGDGWLESVRHKHEELCSEWRRAIKEVKPEAEIKRLERCLAMLEVIRDFEVAVPGAAQGERHDDRRN